MGEAEYFELFDYEGTLWQDFCLSLMDKPFKTLAEFTSFLKTNFHDCMFESVLKVVQTFHEESLLKIINFVRGVSLRLPELFPTGRIHRLSPVTHQLSLTRKQVLTLLSHMFLCSLRESPQNSYWVTFQNWLSDGRACALAYLQSLLGYFEQAMEVVGDPLYKQFWEECVTFERRHIDFEKTIGVLTNCSKLLYVPTIYDKGKIGDASFTEVDFANKDIGYGIYGTQEEILFGSSPEMCVAMLFCDSMLDNETIIIRGAQKVTKFDGYGPNVNFSSYITFPDEFRNERVMIAMDALDFSAYSDPYASQFSKDNLEREVCKLICGFSACPEGSSIDTGNWGCGAFCGDKYLKALLQMIAASVTDIKLQFFTFGDSDLSKNLQYFKTHCSDNNVSVGTVWKYINSFRKENTNVLLNFCQLKS